MDCCAPSVTLQKLVEKAAKAQEAFEKEEKAHKELQALFTKLQTEKQDLQSSLEGEKGNIADFHEKTNKLKAQKADVEAQLNVSTISKYICVVVKFCKPRNLKSVCKNNFLLLFKFTIINF